MNNLKNWKCETCRKDAPGVTREEIADFQSQFPNWQILEVGGEPRLQREYSVADFQAALDFANRVGAEAETQNHHPAFTVEYGKITVAWWTHTIKNISGNDLVMAAKTDQLFAAGIYKMHFTAG